MDMAEYKVTIEVIDILGEGNCSIDQKVGDTYNYPEDIGKIHLKFKIRKNLPFLHQTPHFLTIYW